MFDRPRRKSEVPGAAWIKQVRPETGSVTNRKMKGWFVLGLFLGVIGTSPADDSWYVGIGGSPRSIKQHPSVRMVQETVRINPITGRVHAEFIFQNEGKAVNVPMGFPESGEKELSALRGRSGFLSFASYVDGDRINVKRRVISSNDDSEYRIWWTKEVRFEENQRRTVTVEYEAEGGWDTGGRGWFDYVLGTGATWKGKIGSAKLVLDTSGLSSFSQLHFYPKPTFEKPSSVEWHFVDFEPRLDMKVGVQWFFGFLDVFVDGLRVAQKGGLFDAWHLGDAGQTEPTEYSVPPSWGSPPTRHGNEVMASARAVALWLGAELEYDARTAAVTYRIDQSHWVRVKPRDRRIWTANGVRTLSRTPRLEDGHLRVPFAAIVRGLGGTSAWRKGKLYLTKP